MPPDPVRADRPRPLGPGRLAGWPITAALALLVVAATGEAVGAVVGGRLASGAAEAPFTLVGVLAVLLVGGAALDVVGTTVASGAIARAERVLRFDLFGSTVHQPLSRLQEQAVGEMIDRIDDDVSQVGHLLRTTGVSLGRAVLRSATAWVVAGLTWPWAWVVLPVVAGIAILAARSAGRRVFRRQIEEEVAWSAHAAQVEESVAAGDDVRTALGQPFVLRQYALRARTLLDRVAATSAAAGTTTLRTVLVLNGLLVALALGGVAAVGGGTLTLAALVTLWLLASSFAGQLAQVAQHLPEIQASLGALTRIRTLLDAPREETEGDPLPEGPLSVRFRSLDFAYDTDRDGGFALRGVDLEVPAGTTCALVGRTGSGKSTLASFVPRALEPPPGTTFVGGRDVLGTDLRELRRSVGVVTQRTELLAATLLENVTLFADVPRDRVEAAFDALDLREWVAGLPSGLDTVVGPGGVTLSAGEQQLVAFARLLVRDVRVIVLDEATARMDPVTEHRVVRAAERLLAGRTGLVIAHRLATTQRCDAVAVLDAGRVVQHAPRAAVTAEPGPFRELLAAAGDAGDHEEATADPLTRTGRQRPQQPPEVVAPPPLRSVVPRLLRLHPKWGLVGGLAFGLNGLVAVRGPLSAALWGVVVASLAAGGTPWWPAALLAVCLLAGPFLQMTAARTYFRWWVAVTLRLRLAILRGRIAPRRRDAAPVGEVMARVLDSDRLVRYADRWMFVALAVVSVSVTVALGGNHLVFVLAAGVLVLTTAVAALGAPLSGRTAREAGDRRADFGRSLGSALEAVRTVKLSDAQDGVRGHLAEVDAVRVRAHLRESRLRAVLNGLPEVLLQGAAVVAWGLYVAGRWDVATTLLVVASINGFAWFGLVMAAAVTEAPVARRWLEAATELAGTDDPVTLPEGVDLVGGEAPPPPDTPRVPLRELTIEGLTAVHQDGTVGVEDVDLVVRRGHVVLVVGRVGSGKSSLLRSLAGLVDYEGRVLWNGREVTAPHDFLRPGQVSYVGQVPQVLSASFRDNVALDHDRPVEPALRTARLEADLEEAGGDGALVGHRGVRLSGGQVQRLALARALAADAELLLADDVSSALDARTEVELWHGLRELGVTVIGTTSKRSALQQADVVLVVERGRVVAAGDWGRLSERWGGLAG